MDCAIETTHRTTPKVTDDPLVRVISCTWAPPVELTTDLKVEMDAQIFYATDGSSLIKKQVRSKIWSGWDENMRRSPKIHKSWQTINLRWEKKFRKNHQNSWNNPAVTLGCFCRWVDDDLKWTTSDLRWSDQIRDFLGWSDQIKDDLTNHWMWKKLKP